MGRAPRVQAQLCTGGGHPGRGSPAGPPPPVATALRAALLPAATPRLSSVATPREGLFGLARDCAGFIGAATDAYRHAPAPPPPDRWPQTSKRGVAAGRSAARSAVAT